MTVSLDPYGPPLSRSDRIALQAAYDQLMQMITGCRREDVREALLGLDPGRAAVAALVTFGGLVASFGHPEAAAVENTLAMILLTSLEATTYTQLPGDEQAVPGGVPR